MSFYAFIPRTGGSLISNLLQRTKSEKIVHSRLDQVLSSWEDDEPVSAGTPKTPRTPKTPSSQTQSYIYNGGGLSVKLGLEEVASDLFRVKPYVWSTPDNSAVIVFSGYLQNLSELSRRQGGRSGPATPRCADPNNADQSLERKSSIERSLDVGAATASMVLQMYQDGHQEGNELILLSELQGEFAFVIYDNKRKQAFAARDPSGGETLFYHLAEGGALSFASSRMAVPEAEQPHEWSELPPGHFISGKSPRLHQYALTPQQLVQREMEDEEVLGAKPRRRSMALSSAGPDDDLTRLVSQQRSRSSLDGVSLRRASLDNDVFALDL